MITVDVPADSGIKTIAELHKKFSEAVMKKDELLLNFSSVEKVDLSVIQLVYASMKQAKKNGTVLKFRGLSPELKKQFKLCGMIK